MQNLYLSTTYAKDGTPVGEVLEQCQDAGFTNIELGSNHCFEEDYSHIGMFDFNYLVHNYFPVPRKSIVVNIASSDATIVDLSIEHIKRSIDYTASIGGKLYTFHPGFLADPLSANRSDENYDFVFHDDPQQNSSYHSAWQTMMASIETICNYAAGKDVRIAIESEGSVSKKHLLLMQTREEFDAFYGHFRTSDIGVNLNLGHLNLVASAFNLDRHQLIEDLSSYVVAMELSHNDGVADQHLPLAPDGWYWDYIIQDRFKDCPKILEFRNSTIDEIKACMDIHAELTR